MQQFSESLGKSPVEVKPKESINEQKEIKKEKEKEKGKEKVEQKEAPKPSIPKPSPPTAKCIFYYFISFSLFKILISFFSRFVHILY